MENLKQGFAVPLIITIIVILAIAIGIYAYSQNKNKYMPNQNNVVAANQMEITLIDKDTQKPIPNKSSLFLNQDDGLRRPDGTITRASMTIFLGKTDENGKVYIPEDQILKPDVFGKLQNTANNITVGSNEYEDGVVTNISLTSQPKQMTVEFKKSPEQIMPRG